MISEDRKVFENDTNRKEIKFWKMVFNKAEKCIEKGGS